MDSDQIRRSISATLTEIEETENQFALRRLEIIPGVPEIVHDADAAEAWEIIDRIERKLFPAGMPR